MRPVSRQATIRGRGGRDPEAAREVYIAAAPARVIYPAARKRMMKIYRADGIEGKLR